jgi:hypothetical protein
MDINFKNVLIFDNKGKSVDRYTVVFLDRPELGRGMYEALAMDERPFHPQGFGQHCISAAGKHLGERIEFSDLPDDCKKLVMREFDEVVA